MKKSWKISVGEIRTIVFIVVMSVLASSIAVPAFSEESGFQFNKDTLYKRACCSSREK